jgi:hypothetical protein
MLGKKKEHPKEKSELHPRNRHRERYDFKQLIASHHELGLFVKLNNYGDESIDFFNPGAVKALNKALLKCYYDIHAWEIPATYLCPPIPGRADYLHYAADLLHDSEQAQQEKFRWERGSPASMLVLEPIACIPLSVSKNMAGRSLVQILILLPLPQQPISFNPIQF